MKNRIKEVVKSKETDSFIFKPTKEFYKKIGINRKRWAMLIRNEIAPTIDELQSIASYFDVKLGDLYDLD